VKTSSIIIVFIFLIFLLVSTENNTSATSDLLLASDDAEIRFIIHANTPTEFIGEYLPHKIYFSSIKKEAYHIRINLGAEKHIIANFSGLHVVLKFLKSDTNEAIPLGETDSKQLTTIWSYGVAH
jgi:hypothetical protein